MNIKIKVINFLTGTVEIDSEINVNGDYEIARANHQAFREVFSDCQVNFTIDDNNFIFSPPYNMEQDEIAYDEGRMTWEQYCNKWYNGSPCGCNEDDDIVIIERYENEDFTSRDAVCF